MPLSSGAAFLSPGSKFHHDSIAAATRLSPTLQADERLAAQYSALVGSAHERFTAQNNAARKKSRRKPVRPPSLPVPTELPAYRPLSRASSAAAFFTASFSGRSPSRAATAPADVAQKSWNHKLMDTLHSPSRPKTTPTKSKQSWNIPEGSARPNSRNKALYPMYQIAQMQRRIEECTHQGVVRVPKKVPPVGYSGNPGSPRYQKDGKLAAVLSQHLETSQMYHELAGAQLLSGTRRRTKIIRRAAVMQEVSPSVLEEAYFDERELSTFFRLSQMTGFSKQRLADIFHKWSEVTRHEDMSLSQFSPWMKSIGFGDRLVIEQLFHAFDEDGGGSISFTECALGLSFVLSRDINLPQFELGSDDPRFWEIAFRFLDREAKGSLQKMGVTKLLMAAIKMGARQASDHAEMVLSLVGGDGASCTEFQSFGQTNPEVYRFLRQILVIQNKDSASLEFRNGKARTLRHLKNALAGVDEGDEPPSHAGDDELDDVLPSWSPEPT